jgi:hypothetical protein
VERRANGGIEFITTQAPEIIGHSASKTTIIGSEQRHAGIKEISDVEQTI